MHTLLVKVKENDDAIFLVDLLSRFAFVETILTSENEMETNNTAIRKPTGKPSINDFSGIWADAPKTIEQIRK